MPRTTRTTSSATPVPSAPAAPVYITEDVLDAKFGAFAEALFARLNASDEAEAPATPAPATPATPARTRGRKAAEPKSPSVPSLPLPDDMPLATRIVGVIEHAKGVNLVMDGRVPSTNDVARHHGIGITKGETYNAVKAKVGGGLTFSLPLSVVLSAQDGQVRNVIVHDGGTRDSAIALGQLYLELNAKSGK